MRPADKRITRLSLRRLFCYVLILMALPSCSGTRDNAAGPQKQATVTLMVTPGGLGDNSYNDAAAEGIFAFAGETGTKLRLLFPQSMDEAGEMYRQWMTDNAGQDSAVFIFGSSAYEGLAQSTDNTPFTSHHSGSSRILLFESDAQIDGVSTVMVSRYGVSYLAGVLSQRMDALILAAAKGYPTIENSIAGFMDARKIYAGEYLGDSCLTTLHYLADGEEGFTMPDSAYHFLAWWEDSADFLGFDDLVFPLLGGSETGVVRYLNDDYFSEALMVGMDVDHSGLSSRIPFSVVIRIGDVLKQYLNDWLAGREWPASQSFGMKDGATDIVFTPNFAEHLVITGMRPYSVPDWFKWLYDDYKDEAIRKEEAYEK